MRGSGWIQWLDTVDGCCGRMQWLDTVVGCCDWMLWLDAMLDAVLDAVVGCSHRTSFSTKASY